MIGRIRGGEPELCGSEALLQGKYRVSAPDRGGRIATPGAGTAMHPVSFGSPRRAEHNGIGFVGARGGIRGKMVFWVLEALLFRKCKTYV